MIWFMNEDSNTGKKWITWSMISAIISAISLYFLYMNEQGGTLDATYQSHPLRNGESRMIVVCVEDTTITLNDLCITPIFQNLSRYSLKDFSLSFEVESTNITLTPSSFVEQYRIKENVCLYKYTEGLTAHDNTVPPISFIKINDTIGYCNIKTKASYNGASSAFEFTSVVLFFIVPNKGQVSYDEWKIRCVERISDSVKGDYYDVYYYAKSHRPEYLLWKKYDSKTNMVPVVINPADSVADIIEQRSDIALCKIIKTDSTLTYSLNSDNIETGLYLMESRIRPKKFQLYYDHHHFTFNIDGIKTTKQFSYRYKRGKVPEIDRVFLYPKCITGNVIDIERKNSTYYIRNKSEYAVICCIHHFDGSTYIELNGNGKKRLTDIGEAQLEVFKIDRKTANERNSYVKIWVIILYIIIGFVSIIGVLCFVGNFYIFPKKLIECSFDFTDAFIKTMLYNFGIQGQISKYKCIIYMFVIIYSIYIVVYSLLSLIGLFFCIRFFFF